MRTESALEGKRAIAVINKADLEIKTDIEEIKKHSRTCYAFLQDGKDWTILETIEKLLGTKTTNRSHAGERKAKLLSGALDAITDALEASSK